MPLAAAELAGKLEEAFTRPEFTSAVSDFANSHCHEFAVLETVADASAVEHPLRWYELYREYTHLVESTLEAFLSAEGVHLDEVTALAKSDGWTAAAMCVDYLVASTEYPAFINLMCDFVNLNAMGGVDTGLLGGELGDAGGEPLAGSSAGEPVAG